VKIAIVNLTSGGLSGGYLKYLRALVPLLRQDARISQLDVFIPEGVALEGCGPLRTWPADAANRRRETARARAAAFPWTRTADETIAQLGLAAAMRV
jgi:hypothetical protein